MRRALGGAALIALVLGAVLLATAGGPSNQAHAAANGCVRHTKRIVKHVERHGKRVRIVRLKHYWVCPKGVTPPNPSGGGGSSSQPGTKPPSGGSGGTTETPQSEAEPEANALGVSTHENGEHLSYRLSRTTVKAGKVTIQLNNSEGGDPHTMLLERAGPGGRGSEPEIVELETAPGKQATTSPPVELQPGRYRMWCTLYGHAERGMEAEFEVK